MAGIAPTCGGPGRPPVASGEVLVELDWPPSHAVARVDAPMTDNALRAKMAEAALAQARPDAAVLAADPVEKLTQGAR